MSTTVALLTDRVLSQINALDGRNVDIIRVHQQIRNQYLAMQGRLPSYEVYTASAGTITAGAESFTLPTTSGAEYMGNIRIRLRSMNQDLEKVTATEMDMYRNGRSTTDGFSRSRCFQPVETTDQSVICWVHPINAATETYDLWRGVAPTDLPAATDIAAWTLFLGDVAQTALVFKVSAALLKAMREPDADLRKLNRETAKDWDSEGERLIYQESARRYDIESVGRTQRLVS